MSHSAQITKLRRIVSLITQASETVIAEWENNSGTAEAPEAPEGVQLPNHSLFNAQRTLLAAAGSIEELISDPAIRLLSLSSQYFESRALHIAAEHHVTDILHGHNDAGVHVSVIAKKIGIEERKLSRVLRCLTSQHVFRETATDTFANNTVSKALVGNEDLRAYIMLFALDIHSASDYLPVALTDSKFGPSYKVEETAFNLAVGTDLPRWGWLEAPVPASQVRRVNSLGYPHHQPIDARSNGDGSAGKQGGDMIRRPELEIFGRAMVGGGKVFGAAHVVDYPWGELGDATVVDIGGGIGGFPLQLSELYPKLNFVVQDRAANVAQGEPFWAERNPTALASGKVRLMVHDFFQENPVKDAEVYWLRYILHDWSDDYCIQILSQIRKAMGPKSRLLVADQVMNTTLGCEELEAAPEPLLANYGAYVRYSHQRDLAMMAIINGIERTPQQLKKLLGTAGLKIRKIWECRSQVGIVEAVKI
ncbi:S-adenosyl-L-methionine-dependent methyltransferase [Hypoxylon crocopeplum]|nr:S-adenosyl-L-methionine-dependent methyltransferase [Hypoxylon crocopeplum]